MENALAGANAMSREYCDYIIDQLTAWHPVTCKRMFGGYGLYKKEQIFALILDDSLYFKVGDSNREDYITAGSEPFTYEARGKLVTVSYWQVPLDVLDDPEQLAIWAEKAYYVGLSEKKKPKQRVM